MPLVSVAIVIILFCLYFTVLRPQTINQETQPTTPSVSIEPTTKPTDPPTEPTTEPTEPPTEPPVLIEDTEKYIGVYVESPSSLDVFADGINTIGWFDTFDKISYTKIAMCLDEKRYTAFITLEPTNMSLTGIQNGEYDDVIITYLTELSKDDRIKTELFVRLAHEMEMRPAYGKPWYTWQGNDSAAYVEAWKHIVTLGRQYAPNVKWVWSPNRADKYTEAYYPGDEYVDYVGITLNNTSSKDQTFGTFYETVGTRESLEKYGKPIIFSEVARHRTSQELQHSYIISILEYVQEYENCVGVVLFDKNVTSDRRYQFSQDETIITSFIEKAKELMSDEETQMDEVSMDD